MAPRPLRLIRLAADAQALLVKRQVTFTVNRAIYGAGGAVFAVALFVLLHIISIQTLRDGIHIVPIGAIGIVLAFDAAVATIFSLLATKKNDVVQAEARRLRDDSFAEMGRTAAAGAALRVAGRYVGRKQVFGLALATLTGRLLGGSKGLPR